MTTDIRINPDKNHLNTLAILHYVFGGINAFAGCIPWVHISIGIAMVTGAFDNGRNPPPPMVGVVFIAVGGAAWLFFWTLALLKIIAGRCLARQFGYRYCFFVAILDCLNMPLGTALGVFTILVLSRESVQLLFAGIEPRERHDAEYDEEPEPPFAATPSNDPSLREGPPS